MVGVGGVTGEVDLGIPGYGPGVMVGRGGFATVYWAVQASSGGQVAVKVLSGHLDEQAEFRFERETAALGRLRGHPNICTVYDAGVNAEGRPYLVMEFAERGSLAQRLVARGPLSWAEALEVGVEMAGALETAHRAGLLHRDVKPENVLVTDYGEPRLADFGLARFTDDSASRGGLTATLAHVAPELLGDDTASVASDVYALGSTLFQVLTGHVAFASSKEAHPGSVYRRIEEDPVPDLGPDVPDELTAVVRTAMAKKPAQRYSSAAAMGAALQDVQRAHQLPVTQLPLRTDDATTGPVPPDEPKPDPHKASDKTRKVERPNRDRPEPLSDTAETDELETKDVERDNGTSRWRPGRRVLVAAGGVVALIAAVVIGLELTGNQDTGGNGNTRSTPGKSSTLPDAAYARLLALVPPAAGVCTPEPTKRGAATVTCATSFTTSTGETLNMLSRFTLFDDAASMDSYFEETVGSMVDVAGECPGTEGTTPYRIADGGANEGRVTCYVNGEFPAVITTRTAALVVGQVQGPKGSSLAQTWEWWLQDRARIGAP